MSVVCGRGEEVRQEVKARGGAIIKTFLNLSDLLWVCGPLVLISTEASLLQSAVAN